MFAVYTATAPRAARAVWAEYPVAPVCATPTSVYVEAPGVAGTYAACSGVYLGHGLVVTAGHCFVDAVVVENGTGFGAKVFFGEDMTSDPVGGTGIDAECFVHPLAEFGPDGSWDPFSAGPDLAYCRIDALPSEVVSGLGVWPETAGSIVFPMIPTGCERDILRDRVYRFDVPPVGAIFSGSGRSVQSDPLSTGTKRVVELPLLGQYGYAYQPVASSMLLTQQPAPHGCVDLEPGVSHTAVTFGDSGGPLFVEASDGTLRLIGIAQSVFSRIIIHATPKKERLELRCGGGGSPPPPGTILQTNAVQFVPLPMYLAWLEGSSGVDVTPCFDLIPGEGWIYEPLCLDRHGTGFPEGKTWDTGCYDTSATTSITECGGGLPPGPGDYTLPAAGTTGSPLEYAAVVARTGPGAGGGRTLFSRAVSPPVLGTAADDVLLGTGRVESLKAGPGHDVLIAGPGIDALEGGAGDDLLVGGVGDDFLHGGRGQDVMLGGAGDDTFFVFDPCEQEGVEVIVGGSGHDVLVTSVPIESLMASGLVVVGVEDVVRAPWIADWSACGPLAGVSRAQPIAIEVAHAR